MQRENMTLWSDIKHDFNMWGAAVHGLNLPTLAELDRYWASLSANGEIESNLLARVKSNFTIYPGNEERQQAIRQSISTVNNAEIISDIQNGIAKRHIGGSVTSYRSPFCAKA